MTHRSPREFLPFSAVLPFSIVLYWETGVSYYQTPQEKTLLRKIVFIMTLTHQYFHFWSPASHLFASVSPLCDWAICQKKRALIHYFRVHVRVFLLSKLKLRHKVPQRNSLGLSLFSSSKSHSKAVDSIRVLPCVTFWGPSFTGHSKKETWSNLLNGERGALSWGRGTASAQCSPERNWKTNCDSCLFLLGKQNRSCHWLLLTS